MRNNNSNPDPRPSDRDQYFIESEMREYVDVFKTSSDRTRSSLYIVIVATALIFIANYNLQPEGWPLSRIDKWFSYDLDARQDSPDDVNAQVDSGAASTPAWPFDGDAERLRIARDEYLKQFVARSILTSSPIPGVWIDANDIGILGGITLTLLMTVLFLCIMREHENLYLALYRVRSLCDQAGDHARGDSKANLLYHALAMRQVLGSPPTLALWRKKRVLHRVGAAFFFFAPSLVYLWVLWTNWQTRRVGAEYRDDINRLLIIHTLFAVGISALSLTSWLYSRAMSRRWRRVFFRVNPGRSYAPQMAPYEWLRLFDKSKPEDRLRASVTATIVDSIRPADESAVAAVKIDETVTIDRSHLSRKTRDCMARRLIEKGTDVAERWCSDSGRKFLRLERFSPRRNAVSTIESGVTWVVGGSWTFRHGPSGDTSDRALAETLGSEE